MVSGHKIYGLAAKVWPHAGVFELRICGDGTGGTKIQATDNRGRLIGDCAADTLDELRTKLENLPKSSQETFAIFDAIHI
jgi:hypothetical protein